VLLTAIVCGEALALYVGYGYVERVVALRILGRVENA